MPGICIKFHGVGYDGLNARHVNHTGKIGSKVQRAQQTNRTKNSIRAVNLDLDANQKLFEGVNRSVDFIR